MGIQERDYMRSDGGRPTGPLRFPDLTPRPWWRRIKWQTALYTAALVIAVASGGIWLARDVIGLIGTGGPSEGSLIVNINTATAEELESLPGIGPALAQLIIQGRPYQTVDDLERVRGIGHGLAESIRPLVKTDGDSGRRQSK
jgi:competence ComEA-like helix-hairpin-helix protein